MMVSLIGCSEIWLSQNVNGPNLMVYVAQNIGGFFGMGPDMMVSLICCLEIWLVVSKYGLLSRNMAVSKC